MPYTTTSLIRQAITILRQSLETSKPNTLTPNERAIDHFNREIITLEADSDISCSELWEMFNEAIGLGLVLPMKKADFLKLLPDSMQRVHCARKSHNVQRDGHRVRGFKGVGPRPIGRPPTAAELEPPIEPELVLDPPDLDPRPTEVDPTVPTIIEDNWPVKL